MKISLSLLVFIVICVLACQSGERVSERDLIRWQRTTQQGLLFNTGLNRCVQFMEGWLMHADTATGLIPRNLKESKEIWNAQDAAADNYPFMVLTAALTDSVRFATTMMEMLSSERELTSRVGHLPDTYHFGKAGFANDSVIMSNIIFGSSEYIKDGLMPLTEWLGESPWSDRLLEILDDIWANAAYHTSFGNIPSDNVEVNGEMLQVLSRIYFMTGERKYLDWGGRLADYYLLGTQHPTRNFTSIRLRDHGCEIVSGLCEYYAVVHFALPEKKSIYQPHIHEMLNRILEVGRNEHGLFYDVVNPNTGEIINNRIADNFGYNLNGIYLVYQLDSILGYREAVLKALNSLAEHYRHFDWENGSADGYADAIEGALNLYNREPVKSVESWLDSEIKVMWSKQQTNGIIEGWHGDGNFARTTIMYCLWKSKGVTLHPWRADLSLAAEQNVDTLWISVKVETPWSGKLLFDHPRHQTVLNLPYDWPRINQFPEWYTIDDEATYQILKEERGYFTDVAFVELDHGVEIHLDAGEHLFKVIRKKI